MTHNMNRAYRKFLTPLRWIALTKNMGLKLALRRVMTLYLWEQENPVGKPPRLVRTRPRASSRLRGRNHSVALVIVCVLVPSLL